MHQLAEMKLSLAQAKNDTKKWKSVAMPKFKDHFGGVYMTTVKCLKFTCASPIQKDRCKYNGNSKSSQVII